MTSRARSKGTNKKRTRALKPGTTPADRRLLAKAKRETDEAAARPGLSVVDKIVLSAFKRTGAAFDGGDELSPECSPADLFSLVFDAPNAHDDFLEQVICCLGDDLELMAAAASSGECLDEVITRVANRNHYRIKVAIEVAHRMNQASLTLAGAS
jgi:hypothetical protein